jgi:hypothetical protein
MGNYYEEKFRKEAAMLRGGIPKDLWTLDILSKAMRVYFFHTPRTLLMSRLDHPAIGDAMDEDGSGLISLHETKEFLSRRPAGWSTPELLV